MVLTIAAALVVASSAAFAQSNARKIYRLGHLAPSVESERLARDIVLPKLAKLGFREGQNLVFDGRIGRTEALVDLARELVLSGSDAIIAVGPLAVLAVRAATTTVPIVMFGDDPIRLGLAESLAKPTGNVTGVLLMTIELHGKRLEFLHKAVPSAQRIAALLHSPWTVNEDEKERILRATAARMGLDLLIFTAAGPADFPSAFEAMKSAGAQALVIGSYPGFVGDAPSLAGHALKAGLPTVCPWADGAEAGCLLGYSASRSALLIRVAHLVARIFRGAPPTDLPIEQPAEIELAVNLRTAAALGLVLPARVLARADKVTE